ncbi:hypothetical protein R75461_05285 [Paraburkholderia nemoris]|uniref:hypothetical protein n=1 Tax=Paraburkholderia nemoris TaxID=2793076 RepID=UPI00190A7627|nr:MULTISPECIES: hypothetical protein [Paraburkholderia]MBK3783944.1 hypothetical protein [Paraburkholderia aspalathi]CAE6803131.1 hypothetical protein R75461_05285 [Paraburkholderia nemoris]
MATINIPTPINGPAASQLVDGSGTLTSVANIMPILSNPGNAIPPVNGGPLYTGSFTGSAPIDVSFYDTTAGTLANPGALICTVRSANGYAPVNPNAAYTHGLYCIQRSASSIVITA